MDRFQGWGAGLPAALPACRLAGLPACLPACRLAGLLAGLPACRLADLSLVLLDCQIIQSRYEVGGGSINGFKY